MDTAPPHASPIAPHGGTLNERLAPPELMRRLLAEVASMPSLEVDKRTLSDLKLLAVGALSPLEGFMTRRRYFSVVREMRLENGLVWSIPITLPVDEVALSRIGDADRIALTHQGEAIAVMDIEDAFQPDKVEEALKVYGVDEPAHPGVKAVYERGDHYLGGPVTVFESALKFGELLEYQLTPRQTRALFAERGWKTVVAFQTRNPIHRAHEYLQKCALEMVDGLLIHPLVGETKSDDLDAVTRFRCYERIIELYYPSRRVALAAFPASMRYAGPREAIFHALCRKNYGCTHFIVGRDHAGVGNYYGTYDAQAMFDRFAEDEIGIRPLKFEHAFFCRTCDGMATGKTCPHPAEDHVFLSGTKVREMLRRGKCLHRSSLDRRSPLSSSRRSAAPQQRRSGVIGLLSEDAKNGDEAPRDPREILRWVWETYGESAGLSCSFGGPGGLVLAHMVYTEKLDIPILFVDTDFLFPETYSLKERLEKEWGLRVRTARPALTPEAQAEQFGEDLWASDPDLCCRMRKVEPMASLLEGIDCWVTALRRDQSATRSRMKRFEVHVTEGGTTILKVNPLIDWTRSDVWAYILSHDVPYNPLLDRGYASLGCTHCTAKAIGDDERSGRWAGSAKTECGLHTFTERRL